MSRADRTRRLARIYKYISCMLLWGFAIAACSSPAANTELNAQREVVTGRLRCDEPGSRFVQGVEDTTVQGAPTAEEALLVYLERWARRAGGVPTIVNATTGSLVIDEREQAVAIATQTALGGWTVLTARFCQGIPAP